MADQSVLSLSGFEVHEESMAVCPSTPGGLSIDEFIEAEPLTNAYCQQMSVEQFDSQGLSETEKALNDLIAYMEKDPTVFKKIIASRKKEELSQKGLVSYLKSRIMNKISGRHGDVTEDECQEKVAEVSNGIIMVYNYAQETNGTRFSKRLADKRRQQSLLQLNASPKRLGTPLKFNGPTSKKSQAILRDQTNTFTVASPYLEIDGKKLRRQPIGMHRRSNNSTPLKDVHSELLSGHPMQHLKATATPKSPGGTPKRNLDDSLHWKNPFNTPEPLSNALFRIMETKFQNIRSPSPAADGSCDSDGFSP
ncbi:hypothetical protein CAPTEDRAFT_225596 [Capitella teleta]|uniref:Uncharacterized protein n=1 Tax=Capitella teleta TaxID=283909 RepID=R7ULD6_CAPTE|nr:hypothetical protein CAPTEDRAFT_225596 [Capitella teleta]|eukprot:ELU04067.1 hypothetical protein CAPTEDRAFT_225596 [Capitella teleta]